MGGGLLDGGEEKTPLRTDLGKSVRSQKRSSEFATAMKEEGERDKIPAEISRARVEITSQEERGEVCFWGRHPTGVWEGLPCTRAAHTLQRFDRADGKEGERVTNPLLDVLKDIKELISEWGIKGDRRKRGPLLLIAATTLVQDRVLTDCK